MATLTFEKEESLLRGFIPLDAIQALLKEGKKIESIEFCGNGYCTDALLRLLQQAPQAVFSNLKEVNFKGCYLLSDFGIRCLKDIIFSTETLKNIDLGGCERLTDNTFALLHTISRIGFSCSMKGTGVNYMNNKSSFILTSGVGSLVGHPSGDSEYLHGQVLVAPPRSMAVSVGEYLYNGMAVDRKSSCHKEDLQCGDWTMVVNEISPDSFLFDSAVDSTLTQVVISFDAGAEPKDIKEHVMTTISRVVAKEPVSVKFPEVKMSARVISDRPWMDVHMIDKLHFTGSGLSNISLSDRNIGVYISKTPLTRSNPYFEVVVTKAGEGGKIALLIGVLHDLLYSHRHPMDSQDDHGGVVDGFDLTVNQKIGFGVKGTWLSEYVPSLDAKYFFTVDGVEKTGHVQGEDNDDPHIGMYPLLSLLGEVTGSVELGPLVSPPPEVAKKYEKEERWMENGFCFNCLVDNDGILSYATNYSNPGDEALWTCRHPVSAANNSFTIKLLDKVADGNYSTVKLGLGPETLKEKMANMKCSIYMLIGKGIRLHDQSGAVEAEVKFDAKVGDTVTVKVTKITSELGVVYEKSTVNVEFYHNKKQVYVRENWQYGISVAGERLVPFVSQEKGATRVQLQNYRPSYHRPAPLLDQITMGRCHYINVQDSGVLEYRQFHKKNAYGMFMAKTPLNKQMLSFTVEVTSLTPEQWFGIGVAHSNYAANSFVGWKQASVGWHSDNGRLYANSSSGMVEPLKVPDGESLIKEGDTVSCRVEPIDDKTPLKFEGDGNVASQQKVKVVFLKGDTVVIEYEHEHVADGLYPVVCLREGTVCLKNFYAETNDVWDMVEQQKEKPAETAKTDKTDAQKDYQGCEFLVVGVSTGQSDPGGKLQIVQQQLDFTDHGWAQLAEVNTAVADMESHLGQLNLQDQQLYANLCAVQERFKHFEKHSSQRVQFKAIDVKSTNGRVEILKAVQETQEAHRNHQPQRYTMSKAVKVTADTILALVAKEKLVTQQQIYDSAEDGVDGAVLDKLLIQMQDTGKVLLLRKGGDMLVADFSMLMKIEERMTQLSPTKLCDTMVTCIGQTSHVWDAEALHSKILSDVSADKLMLFCSVLEEKFGLLQLLCLRCKPEDPMYIYVIQQNLTNPPSPMTDYWSSDQDNKDFVVMKQVYMFPVGMPENLISLVISNTLKYGRAVIVTAEGIVYQNGAVQTVILRHITSDDKVAILVESRCYMPDLTSLPDRSMSKETVSYVRDYTWNVFCIFTDLIDYLLYTENVVPAVQKEVFPDLVNVSVGCKHQWTIREDKVKQTVCTLCNCCCDNGASCKWNGIMGNYLRECGCGTELVGCRVCGICKSCAVALWNIRTRLRPFAATTTGIFSTVTQKASIKTKPEDEKKADKSVLRDPVRLPSIPLDPFLYNEVEMFNLGSESKVICLTEESDGTTVQAFPGKASYIDGVKDLTPVLSMTHEPAFRMKAGDHVKIRIQDPLGASYVKREESTVIEEGKIEPQYFAFHGRETKVCHETGILVYDTASSSIPVGQFIGSKQLTKTNNTFSIRILCTGSKGTIAMGLVPKNYAPNRQPGWNKQSIAFHADDGGVFLESGLPTRRTKACKEGDIMTFKCDLDKNKGWFLKNGEQMIELNLNPSRLGFYPCVGFHSVGEAVQLMEKDVWNTDNPSDPVLRPPAYATYKYGNLWISPGYRVNMSRVGSTYHGWLLLHNPSKDPVGFKVVFGKTEKDVILGCREHKKDFAHFFTFSKAKIPEDIIVEWQSLESGRTYTQDDLKLLFGVTDSISQSSHQHRLRVAIQESSSVMEELPVCGKEPPEDKRMLRLEVFRNGSLVNDYWLKFGNYHFSVESNTLTSSFVLKYPKCPSFQYPKGFQKGMKLVIALDSSQSEVPVFAECIVVDLYSGGKMLALEYSPEDSTINTTICALATSPCLQFTEFQEESAKVLGYQARSTPDNLTRTFVWAPPYLLSEGSKKGLVFLDPEWKANTLRSFSQCSQVFTRLTVQEQQITNAAKNLLDWLKVESNYMYAYLPNPLDIQSLCYPKFSTMFKELNVHRMCFCVEELMLQASLNDSLMWRIPLHFVDIPGVTPQNPLPIDVLYANNTTAWMYTSLISDKLLLPSYSKMIVGNTDPFTREQIESMLYSLMRSYAALCGIFCARIGGIEKSEPAENAHLIFRTIGHSMDQIVKFSGKPITESDIFIKDSGSLTCKAHLMNTGGTDSKFPDGLEFSYDYFEPYTELVSTFSWSGSKLKSLPADFFERFPYLQCFCLGKTGSHMHQMTEMPEGLSKLKELKIVQIRNTNMTKLPSDLFMSPSVVEITCCGMPIKELPEQFLAESQLSSLKLNDLLIKEVPEGLGKLGELTALQLCHNLLTDLPESLSALKKLRILRLTGVPWIAFEGNRSHMTYEQYLVWHHNNPSVKNWIGADNLEKLFRKYDYNNNGSLDEEEISGLNLHLFFDVPRLGSKDLNDEVTGGIPPVVFSMKNLNRLDLDYQSISMVPHAIYNLQNMNTLNLAHNPLLESLPGSLGHLPNIKSINLLSCPMLRTPPNEVVGRGFESVKAYLKRLAGGFTECRRTKLMVVGLGGAGKTSLLRALMSANKKTSGTEKEIPTDGIDIVQWAVSNKEGKEVTFSTWDFAGQAVYYNTHQFFLSKRAVYLLLWSMRQGYEHAGLDFWLSSISCHAPGTPILVIGTQCDLIPQAEVPEKELRERYPQIVGFHQVSSITGTGINELQENLLDVTLSQGYMGEKIPQVWLNFEKRIIAERLTKKNYLKWDVARSYAMEAGIYDEKDVRLAVQLLHDLGTLQYFDNDFLQDYVVINPQWIVNVMACVVSAQDSPIQKNKGRFLHSDIPVIWKDYDEDLRPWLLRLTEDFDLTFPLPKEPVNVVPCLLPQEEPNDLKWPSLRVKSDSGIRETKMVYRFAYLPSGLFNRAQVRLFQFSDGKQVWKKGSLLSKNKHLALIKQTDDTELVVLVQGPRPENILFLIHEVFESIVEESFNGVTYDFFVPCPDCILKEGSFDPCLFNATLVQRAKDMKAPFIQCHKFFHWISMAQLQEKMPAESREVADFDFQLQQSLVALEELNNDLTIDTAVIYCIEDQKSTHPDALNPALIRDDILSWNHQCWFAEDMESVSYVDLTAAVKNCRVLIACVSDNFERNQKCRDLFIYAKETMNKEIIIVVLGESMEWQNTDLGMKIGQQERKLMTKTLSRYVSGRQAELKEWLEEKLTQQKTEKIVPDVFISYSWSNSANAAKKSGRQVPGAIGWADPRQMKVALNDAGFSCWIDVENVGKEKKGIFADMAAGIRNSKIMLACISDEYAGSDNCMMELRFGILNMELPLVVCVVGTGNEWKETEVAMLLRRARAPEVYLQRENEEGFKALVQYCKDALVNRQLSSKKKKEDKGKEVVGKDLLKKKKTEKDKNSSIAYKEEFELIQRKFMRHILGTISSVNSVPMPRLLVVDFVKSVKTKGDKDGRDSSMKAENSSSSSSFTSKKVLRPKTSTRSRDRLQAVDPAMLEDEDETNWSSESFCIKVLCENEERWHVCDKMYPLAFRSREMLETFMKNAAPYLYRIYSILKQSPIKLKCFYGTKGEAYQNWIRTESEENLDFVGALQHLRTELINDEASEFINCLARCRLPSGKIVWLCDEHQKGEHVSKLSVSSTGGVHNTQKVLFNEDILLKENLEKSDIYKKRKAIKSTKVAPKLPQPAPLPQYNPPAPPAPDTPARPPTEKPEEKTEEPAKKDEKKEDSPAPPGPPPPVTKKDEKTDDSTDNKQQQKDSKSQSLEKEEKKEEGKEEKDKKEETESADKNGLMEKPEKDQSSNGNQPPQPGTDDGKPQQNDKPGKTGDSARVQKEEKAQKQDAIKRLVLAADKNRRQRREGIQPTGMPPQRRASYQPERNVVRPPMNRLRSTSQLKPDKDVSGLQILNSRPTKSEGEDSVSSNSRSSSKAETKPPSSDSHSGKSGGKPKLAKPGIISVKPKETDKDQNGSKHKPSFKATGTAVQSAVAPMALPQRTKSKACTIQ